MPTCRNCGNTSTFVVSLTITALLADDRLGPPRSHVDLQCHVCDSTHVDWTPGDVLGRRDDG